MRWLNRTYANRFNRFRNENGHVFQGRYKSILLEPDAVPSVAHYIHLNPVRADVLDSLGLTEGARGCRSPCLWEKHHRFNQGESASE